jgi:hypothetical protein
MRVASLAKDFTPVWRVLERLSPERILQGTTYRLCRCLARTNTGLAGSDRCRCPVSSEALIPPFHLWHEIPVRPVLTEMGGGSMLDLLLRREVFAKPNFGERTALPICRVGEEEGEGNEREREWGRTAGSQQRHRTRARQTPMGALGARAVTLPFHQLTVLQIPLQGRSRGPRRQPPVRRWGLRAPRSNLSGRGAHFLSSGP